MITVYRDSLAMMAQQGGDEQFRLEGASRSRCSYPGRFSELPFSAPREPQPEEASRLGRPCFERVSPANAVQIQDLEPEVQGGCVPSTFRQVRVGLAHRHCLGSQPGLPQMLVQAYACDLVEHRRGHCS